METQNIMDSKNVKGKVDWRLHTQKFMTKLIYKIMLPQPARCHEQKLLILHSLQKKGRS